MYKRVGVDVRENYWCVTKLIEGGGGGGGGGDSSAILFHNSTVT